MEAHDSIFPLTIDISTSAGKNSIDWIVRRVSDRKIDGVKPDGCYPKIEKRVSSYLPKNGYNWRRVSLFALICIVTVVTGSSTQDKTFNDCVDVRCIFWYAHEAGCMP
jgi:hypothetical protein